MALATALAALALGAAAVPAEPGDPPGPGDPAEQPAPAPVTTTAPTTTIAPATTAATATTTTSTPTAGETTPTTTAAATEPSTTAAAAAATLAKAPAPADGCPAVGAVGLVLPSRPALVLAPFRQLASATFAYPSDGSVVTASGLSIASCTDDAHPTTGMVQVRALSLFGGVVTARAATLSLTGGRSTVSGLQVGGRPATLTPGKPIRLGNWGYMLAPDPSASTQGAFEIELVQPRDGLPAGTIVFVPYAKIAVAPAATQQTPTTTTAVPTVTEAVTPATPRPAASTPAVTRPRHDETFTRPRPRPAPRVKKPNKHGHLPLTITPPLKAGPYMFPVAGGASYGDSYGAARYDVSGGWHHGDDIFAPLGTPVVAVADGSLNRVGWERLGGWRLWVRDRAGDQFYYAHMSAYSPLALRHRRVHRGDVIGFVGNTGDAFTTIPHLHFEVHPRSLLHLHYDGAVDPTRYLSGWDRPGELDVPRPVHPRLPRSSLFFQEASQNWRELLAARGLTRHVRAEPAPEAVPAPRDPLGILAARTAVRTRTGAGAVSPVWPAIGAALVVAVLGLAVWRRPDWTFFASK